MDKLKLVFFGTGPVSLATLQGIHDAFDIEAIITKPDRISPSGRTHDHPVKEFGATHSIPVHQVAHAAGLDETFKMARFTSRLGLVVDFGMIIPEEVIDCFELGIINSHFSLLPLLRGADPITFAILEGHRETGVSLMKIVPALDEGDILSQERMELDEDTTTPELTEKLVGISNRLLRRDLAEYAKGRLVPQPQDSEITPTYTRKLTKQDGEIDWSKPADQIEREVRAYMGWPGSRTQIRGRDVTITATHVSVGNKSPDGEALVMPTGDGTKLTIDRLKPAGKREMTAAEFLRGLK